MLANDFVQNLIDTLPVKKFLIDSSLDSTASGANKRCQNCPAQGILKAEHQWIHG
ncbi:MAG: hypothetical protein ACO2Y2_01070 [Poseidonia sp.]